MDQSSFLYHHQGHRRNPERNSSKCQEQMLPSSEYQHETDSYAVDDTPETIFRIDEAFKYFPRIFVPEQL